MESNQNQQTSINENLMQTNQNSNSSPTSNANSTPTGVTITIGTNTPTSNNVCPAVVSSPNVVKIPVPVVPPPEDIYTYVAIKGSLHAQDCSIFGLNQEEIIALSKRFSSGSTEIINGIEIKASPIDVINTISKLGYKVVCSTGEAEPVWTMQREI